MSHIGNDIKKEQDHEARLEELENHDCEMLSTCCGAGSNEYIDDFCGAFNEWSEFECSECEDKEPELLAEVKKLITLWDNPWSTPLEITHTSALNQQVDKLKDLISKAK